MSRCNGFDIFFYNFMMVGDAMKDATKRASELAEALIIKGPKLLEKEMEKALKISQMKASEKRGLEDLRRLL